MEDLWACFAVFDMTFAGLPLYVWAGIVVFCSGLGFLIKGNR